jgi:hypothetical protein
MDLTVALFHAAHIFLFSAYLIIMDTLVLQEWSDYPIAMNHDRFYR